MEIERRNRTLPPLPTPLSGTEEADQGLPTRTGRVGEPTTPASPKESIQLCLFRSEDGRAAGGAGWAEARWNCDGAPISCGKRAREHSLYSAPKVGLKGVYNRVLEKGQPEANTLMEQMR